VRNCHRSARKTSRIFIKSYISKSKLVILNAMQMKIARF
jgi:hypothetical protein